MLRKVGLIFILLALAASLIAVGCGKKRKPIDEGEDGEGPKAKPAYSSKGNEGTITGKITFDGDAPARQVIDMSQDANCAAAGGDKMSDDVVVTNGRLANVFVYLQGGDVDKFSFKPAGDEKPTLDQRGCRYHPHVLGLMTAQPLTIINSDQAAHNVHPQPKNNQEWNESQPPGAPPIVKSFNRKETLIKIKCNQHPWMTSWAGVLDHPFFAVSAEDGTYTIKGVPPGTYTIKFWHERFGEQSQSITVPASGTATAPDVVYKAGGAARPASLEVVTLTLP